MHINIEKVSHQYETKQGMLPVLKDLSLSIKRKGFTAIVGPSGCGKSTGSTVILSTLILFAEANGGNCAHAPSGGGAPKNFSL